MGVRIGIVGLGMFGVSFVKLFKAHPDVTRLALCDLDPERVKKCAAEHGITETYASLDDICRSDLDAVVLITQHWMHAPQAVQAMNAGKCVWSAVPAAKSLEECDALVEAVRRTGMIYMNAETSYYRAEAVFCRAKAAEGAFGEIVHIQAEYMHDLSHGLYDVARNRWGKEWSMKKSGGIPMYYPTHSVAFPVSVTGAHMVSVSAQGFTYPNDDWFRRDTESGNVFSNEVALFRMSNGATARIAEFRRIGTPCEERVSAIYGTEASFEENFAGCAWMTKKTKERIEPKHDTRTLPPALAADLGGPGGSHAFLVHDFVQAVKNRRHPPNNVWQAVRYLAPGLVAHESSLRDGELRTVPDWGDAPG